MQEQFTIGLTVTNQHGVLNRITGLYNKRGYNIDSLAVGETEDPAYSRMIIVSRGDDCVRKQMLRQLNKLYDVQAAVLIDGDDAIFVEHLLIKISTANAKYTEIIGLVNEFGGKVLNVGADFVTADITGTPERVRKFVEKCKPMGIHELSRSGILALSGGDKNDIELNNQEEQENGKNVL